MDNQAFIDVPPDHPFFNDIQRANFLGIAQGFPDGTFRPDETATRAEVAAFVTRGTEKALIFSGVTSIIAIIIALTRDRS